MAEIEDVFKALGDPTRVKIVRMLAENGEMCVCKIIEALDMTQPAISHHMSVLKHAGITKFRKEGQWIHYSLDVEAFESGPFEFLSDIIKKAKSPKQAPDVCNTNRNEEIHVEEKSK